MRTLLRTFAIALLSTSSFLANATRGDETTNAKKSLKVSVFQAANTMKMSVYAEKPVGKKLSVLLKTESGYVVYSEYIKKNDETYYRKFDLKDLEDGKYLVEISDGESKIVKKVEVGTIKPDVVANERFITMN